MYVVLTTENGNAVAVNLAVMQVAVNEKGKVKLFFGEDQPIVVMETWKEVSAHIHGYNRIVAGINGLPGTIGG